MRYYQNDWMIGLMVGGVILLALIILVIYILVRTYKKTDHESSSGYSGYSRANESEKDSTSRALGILAERYAKGEISDEEYKQMKSEIMKP